MSVRVHPVVLRMRDDDGKWVTEGDTVHFSYGIPPVGVSARIIERGGKLIGLCPGHNPPEFNLRFLRHYVCSWYKHNDEAVRPAVAGKVRRVVGSLDGDK